MNHLASNRFTLTLGTVIRAYDGASVPIQTPSIYFAGRWQRLKHRRTPSSSIIWMCGAGVAHHSNGQDGCTFENQTRVNGACQSQPAGSSGVLNTNDGSFGVNYIEVRAARSSRTIVDSVEVGTALTLGLDYRLYVPWKFPPGGSGLTQIQHLFGRSEFQGLFQQEWPTRKLWKLDHLQLTLRGSTRFGGGSAVATSGSADVAWFGFAGGTAGPFVRLYSGNDYYNIRFLEERRYLMAGVVWGPREADAIPQDQGTEDCWHAGPSAEGVNAGRAARPQV